MLMGLRKQWVSEVIAEAMTSRQHLTYKEVLAAVAEAAAAAAAATAAVGRNECGTPRGSSQDVLQTELK